MFGIMFIQSTRGFTEYGNVDQSVVWQFLPICVRTTLPFIAPYIQYIEGDYSHLQLAVSPDTAA